MKFKADEIASVIQQEIEQYESQIDVREVGRVLEVGDGIARVVGLELLQMLNAIHYEFINRHSNDRIYVGDITAGRLIGGLRPAAAGRASGGPGRLAGPPAAPVGEHADGPR